MVPAVEAFMLIVGAVAAVAIVATRLSLRLGVPALALFLGLGMLAGSDGIGGIWFDDPRIAWTTGVVALALLLFAAGLDTDAAVFRRTLGPGLALASIGVAVSATLVAAFYTAAFDRPLAEGFLLGAVVSSTDAAAVFGVLRSSGARLQGRIEPLLEVESGSNDPVAVLLTFAATAVLGGAVFAPGALALGMGTQLGLGLVLGLLGGRAIAWALNRLRVPQQGLYPIFATALAFVVFGATFLAGGSPFLAVYVAGIAAGSGPLVHRRAVVRYHDALAWLAQITMFVLLGLFVFPSRLPGVAGEGLLIAAFLLFVARPLSVVASLAPFGVPWREQAMVAWLGLRGAVPIILATWPRVMGVPGADRVFDVVFFVVIVSVLVQGLGLPHVARALGVAQKPATPLDPVVDADREEARGTSTARVSIGAELDGRPLVEAGLPAGVLVALIERDGERIVPTGQTELHAGDVALVVMQSGQEGEVRTALAGFSA